MHNMDKMEDSHIARERRATITTTTNSTTSASHPSSPTLTHSPTPYGKPPMAPHTKSSEKPRSILKTADIPSPSTSVSPAPFKRRVSFEEDDDDDDFSVPRLRFATPEKTTKTTTTIDSSRNSLLSSTSSTPMVTTTITANAKDKIPKSESSPERPSSSSSSSSSMQIHIEGPKEEKRISKDPNVSPTKRKSPHRECISSSPYSPDNSPTLTPRLSSQVVHSVSVEKIDPISSASVTLSHPPILTTASELFPHLDVTVSDITASPISVESYPRQSNSMESIQERSAIVSVIRLGPLSELEMLRNVVLPEEEMMIPLDSHRVNITPISLEGRNQELDISNKSFPSPCLERHLPEPLHILPTPREKREKEEQQQQQKEEEETSKRSTLIETDMKPIIRPTRSNTLVISDKSGTSFISRRDGKADSVSDGVDPNDVIFDDSFIETVTISDTLGSAAVSAWSIKGEESLRKVYPLDDSPLTDLPIHLYPPLIDTDEIPDVSSSTPFSTAVSLPLDASLFKLGDGDNIRNEQYIYATQKPIIFHKMFVNEKSKTPLLRSQSASSLSVMQEKDSKVSDYHTKSIRTTDESITEEKKTKKKKKIIAIKDKSFPSNTSIVSGENNFPKRQAKPVIVEYVNKLSGAWQDKLREDDENNNRDGNQKNGKPKKRWISTAETHLPKHLQDKAKQLFPEVFSGSSDPVNVEEGKVISWDGNVLNTSPLLPIRRKEIVLPEPVKTEKVHKESKLDHVADTGGRTSSTSPKTIKKNNHTNNNNNNNNKPFLKDGRLLSQTSVEEKENIDILGNDDLEFEEIDSLHESSTAVMSNMSSPTCLNRTLPEKTQQKQKQRHTPLKSKENGSNFNSEYGIQQKQSYETDSHIDTQSCARRFEKLQRTFMQLAVEHALSNSSSSFHTTADAVEDITMKHPNDENNNEKNTNLNKNNKNSEKEKEKKKEDFTTIASTSDPPVSVQRRNILRAPIPSPLPSPPRQRMPISLTQSTEGLIRTPDRITPAESGDESTSEQPSERQHLFPPAPSLVSSLHTQYGSHYSDDNDYNDKSIKQHHREGLPERCVTDRVAMKRFAREISAIAAALKGSGVTTMV